MAYPEKISFPDKVNRKPVTDPDGQFSANEANEIRDKLNANALFYDVHDDLSALQVKFPNPPVGAFAYLRDGSCYRCVSLGWATDPVTGSGGGVSYFKGYYTSENAVRIAYPDGQPGWRVVVRVTGGNDKEGLWDEDDADWFFFDFSTSISKTYVDDGDAATLQSAKEYADTSVGGSSSSISKISYFNSGYDSGLTYQVTAAWTILGESFGSIENPVSQKITLEAADATNSRIDVIALNIDGTITKITGVPAANPVPPSIDPNTQLEGTFILIPANATVPDGVNQILVYDENTQVAGGEFNTTEDTSGARINLASTIDFKTGAKCIEVTQSQFYDTITFTPPAPLSVADISELSFHIKNKPTAGDRRFFIRFVGENKNGKRAVRTLASGQYNELSEIWQFVAMSLSSLNFPTLTKIEFVANGFPNYDFGFFLDNIKLTGGTENVSGDYVTRPELETAKQEAIDAAKVYTDTKLSLPPLEVNASRNLAATDNGRKLYVTVNSTLTYPTAGLGDDFECNIVTALTITATIAGTTLLAPNGTILLENKMGHCFVEPINNKLSLNGGFSE